LVRDASLTALRVAAAFDHPEFEEAASMVTNWFNRMLQTESRQLRQGRRKEGDGEGLRFDGLRAGRTSAPNGTSQAAAKDPYVLETGGAAAYRLSVLHGLYGPGTRRLLSDAGPQPGMRVADVGCGVGMVTALVGEMVGAGGHVVGFDVSDAQLTEARERVNCVESNFRFVEASATDTGWPAESFDVVYCRFLLIHLREPEQALREMRRLLKPNGILVCEDGDLTSAGSEPPSALGAFADLFGRLGPLRGVDYTLGRRLYQMVIAAGFEAPAVHYNQPVAARGELKRLLELSVAEAGPAFVDAGLISDAELDRTLEEMRRLSTDGNVVAVMPRMSQVWARK
jgi:SAM-dependent methyltransferase